MSQIQLLMLCMGNICRSPMAEGAFRARLAAAGIKDVQLDSAGTGGWHSGQAPDKRAIACAKAHGVDIAALRARQLNSQDFMDFDWILAADAQNLDDARWQMPAQPRAKLALLLPWALGNLAPAQGAAAHVPDPYTGGMDDFEAVWALVDNAAQQAIARRAWQQQA